MRVETAASVRVSGGSVVGRRPDAKLAEGGSGLRRRSRRGGPQREPLDEIYGERVEEGDGLDLRPPPHEYPGEAAIGDLGVSE